MPVGVKKKKWLTPRKPSRVSMRELHQKMAIRRALEWYRSHHEATFRPISLPKLRFLEDE